MSDTLDFFRNGLDNGICFGKIAVVELAPRKIADCSEILEMGTFKLFVVYHSGSFDTIQSFVDFLSEPFDV